MAYGNVRYEIGKAYFMQYLFLAFLFLFSFCINFLFLKFNEISYLSFADIYSYDIFYVHVCAALFNVFLFWFALFYTLLLLIGHAYFSFIIYRHCLLFSSFFFSMLSIFTGELWSIATWGTWAPLDSRLLSQLLILLLNLCVFYLVYFSFKVNVRNAFILSHYLFIFLSLNIPLVKYSVGWWNSLHMPSVLKITHNSHDFFFFDFFFLILCLFLLYFIFIAIIYSAKERCNLLFAGAISV